MDVETHEHTLNVALGEALDLLRKSWKVRSEPIGQVFLRGGRPDILVEEASGWPVVIEAERSNHASAEKDAVGRLGRWVAKTGRRIQTAIALVYPPSVHSLGGPELRKAIDQTRDLEYALYTRNVDKDPERLPSRGWIKGGVRDLAMLVHRAAVPPPRIEALASELEKGVELAAEAFTRQHGFDSQLGNQVASILGQSDDDKGQTRKMAMTVIANALVFHESLADAGFVVRESEGGPKRAVRPVQHFQFVGEFDTPGICDEWDRVLKVNYVPIFWSAKEMLRLMPTETANEALGWLWWMGRRLVARGVTRSHDLMGIVFQELIADRKFLAANYTRPEAAALLAALALPADKPPGGADWGDGETLAGAQIGDFACGTGTLLSTAYQRMSFLHELHGGDPRLLHGPMMKHGLVGLDVINIAVHLTAAMLAGSHPDTPFDGDCLLTMPYGGFDNGEVAIGSLDLLNTQIPSALLERAVAVSAGGRVPEEVAEIADKVGHGKFDLVIMNPPFVRSTGMEGEKLGRGNSAFAAFNTDDPTRKRMQKSLVKARDGSPLGTGNNGLAADFLDLSLRKTRDDGVIALVLPLSGVSGRGWENARNAIAVNCNDITVITIAGVGSKDSSFSADTDIAECLLIARRGEPSKENVATFVMLRRRPQSAVEAELLANEISRIRGSGNLRSIKNLEGLSRISIGEQEYGGIISAPIPQLGPWPLVGIIDEELAQVSWNLERGLLMPLGMPGAEGISLPVVRIKEIAGRGPYHADIYWDHADGTPRGPFEKIQPAVSPVPTYPMLWAHHAPRERRLVVEPDSEGRIKAALGKVTQSQINEKAARVWATATRAHYNRDLRFNSQSLIVAFTERPCIGGMAWPSVIFENPDHEYPFTLWCNSTLGLLMHWWVSNKTQSGRGRTTITGIPNIPTFDVRTLTGKQLCAAKEAFGELRERRFLPFDQIDEDPARAELDSRLLVDVLGLPESLVAPDGPIDLLRRKLAQEPQIHGGKDKRVVFHHNPLGGVIETTERRKDR